MSIRALCLVAMTAVLALIVPSFASAHGGHGQTWPQAGHDFGWWGHGHHHGDHGPKAPPALSPPLAQGLAGPLQIAVGDRGDVFVAQGFAPVLTHITRKGTTDLPVPGLDGIDTDGWRVLYTTRNGEEPTDPGFSSFLNRLKPDGSGRPLADLWLYEQQANPDQFNHYGFESITPECAAQLPPQVGPAQYTGQLDVNPYGVAIDGRRTYIADAGGNDVVEVRHGDIRTVAVLPPQPLTVTDAVAAALGLPDCAKGLTYAFEPVPTDVEVGRDGYLYVTTLPGGPEDPSLGARGSLYRIDAGTATCSGSRRASPARRTSRSAPSGIYVSELFGGRISRAQNGGPVPFLDVASPAGLEYSGGKLYVGYDVFANGSVATIGLRGGWDH